MTTTNTLEVTSLVPPAIYEHPIQAHQIPYVIEQLRLYGKDASWIVFIFDTPIRSPLTDDPYPNLQYSVINGVVGLDWVLLGQRNIADQEKLTRFIKRHQHKVAKQCQNEVFYLRVEDGNLSSLGTSIVQDFYGVAPDTQVRLLVQGLEIPDWTLKLVNFNEEKSLHDQPLVALEEVSGLDTLSRKRAPSSYDSVAWPPFAQKLASTLEKLQEEQYLILSVKRSNRFIQFSAQGSFGIRVETTSNNYLSKAEQLNKLQRAALIKIGWQAPSGTHANSTPERDPDGSPNFFIEFPAPVSFEAVANFAVRTFTEILRLPHPGNLEYEAFDEDIGAIALPDLGLRLAVRTPQTNGQEELAIAVLATLRETTGLSDLEYDKDGDIGLRNGSALVFVRLINEPLCVRIYSPLLRDVEERPDILVRLNDINANQPLMRFIYRNGIIFGATDIPAAPFVSAHVAKAFEHFCAIANGMDNLLQAEFGGQTAYGETMPSLLKH